MKKSLFIIILLTLFALIGVGGFMWVKNSFSSVSNKENFQSFLITKGEGASSIASKLENKGIIRSAFAFKFYTQLTGISQRIQAGEYSLSPHMSLTVVVSTLTSAPLEVWVTVPEGLRREEIVSRFIEGLTKKDEEIDVFRKEFQDASEDLEGMLFPDTYLFPKEASASAVVAKMKRTFDVKTKEHEDEIKSNNLSLSQLVTLASIIERETKTDSERPMVAGVLLNRLRIGMALQADASVQYAIGSIKCKNKVECEWWVPVTRDDLEINSPYNVYKFNGLPPGPIANPGLSSLLATIRPERSDYLYYLHDPSGQIHFAKTLDEHNANVRKYLGKQ